MGSRKSSGNKSSISNTELEHRQARWFYICDKIYSLIKTSIVCCTIVISIYVGIYLPIKISHGENTTINLLIQLFTDLKINVILPWCLFGGSAYWAYSEKRKRLRERRERDERIAKLEKMIDPNRSSSNLTVDGLSEIKGD